MLIVLIETSTERAALFLLKGNDVVFEAFLPPGLHSSTDLLPLMNAGFEQNGVTPNQIDLIAVSAGPGSYTGMRVGAMAAKTLSFASGIPLVGVPTLACFSSKSALPYAVVVDAKMGGVYFMKSGEQTTVASVNEAASELVKIPLLVTPNSKLLEKKFREAQSKVNWIWEETAANPQRMSEIAIRKYENGEFSTDGSLQLDYMRKTQAEIEKGF